MCRKNIFTTNIKTGIDVSHARWVIIYEIMKKWINYLRFTPRNKTSHNLILKSYKKTSSKCYKNIIKN